MLGTPTRFRAQHLGLVDQWKNPLKKWLNRRKHHSRSIPCSFVCFFRTHHVEITFGEFIDFGHFWGSHRHQYLPGKVKSPHRFGTYVIYMLKRMFYIHHMFHQNESDHKFISPKINVKKKHTVSQQKTTVFIRTKKHIFDHFWRNALSPFLTT